MRTPSSNLVRPSSFLVENRHFATTFDEVGTSRGSGIMSIRGLPPVYRRSTACLPRVYRISTACLPVVYRLSTAGPLDDRQCRRRGREAPSVHVAQCCEMLRFVAFCRRFVWMCCGVRACPWMTPASGAGPSCPRRKAPPARLFTMSKSRRAPRRAVRLFHICSHSARGARGRHKKYERTPGPLTPAPAASRSGRNPCRNE